MAWLPVVQGATPESAATKLAAFLDGLPDAGPAYAVRVVSPDRVLLDFARGTRRASALPSRVPVTGETPFYIASQTKAFVGLLAAKLDAKGILKLDSTLADHWPDLKWPDGLDPKAWTLRQLLSHQVPLSADDLVITEAYIRHVELKDYPSQLERHTRKREPGFKYSNLGYSIYAATLEKATGQTWKYWLDQEMLRPLGLKNTRTQTSTFARGEVAWGHQWLGRDKGWHEIPPKSDDIMHAAGGLVSTPSELGRWLQMHLRLQGPVGSEFDSKIFEVAHQALAKVNPRAKNAYELPCNGYALGWNICDFQGRRLYIHGGSYSGTRTMMAFSPDLGVGIAVFSNSDNMTGWLVSRTIVQFMQFLVDDPDADKMAELRIRQYPLRANQWLDQQLKQQQEEKIKAEWAGWSWRPRLSELKSYEGQYQTADGLKTIEVFRDRNALKVSIHAYQAHLEPAARNLFGMQVSPLDVPEPVTFEEGVGKRITTLHWRGELFHRSSKKTSPTRKPKVP